MRASHRATTATSAPGSTSRHWASGSRCGFIITFTVVLLGWMLLNTDVLKHWGLVFDPHPFMFLNLLLSTLAAIQAPIIMMSQNRQSQKDRQDARVDFETNIRAELAIAQLHRKSTCC